MAVGIPKPFVNYAHGVRSKNFNIMNLPTYN